MPSGSAAFTSACSVSSARTAVRLPCFTASTSRTLPPAASRVATAASAMSHAPRRQVVRMFAPLNFDPPGAEGAELVDLAPEFVGEIQHQIGQRRLLSGLDVTIALHQSGAAANERDRHVEPGMRIALA